MKNKTYKAGTFADLKEFTTKKDAIAYATKTVKETGKEVRVILPNGNNLLIN